MQLTKKMVGKHLPPLWGWVWLAKLHLSQPFKTYGQQVTGNEHYTSLPIIYTTCWLPPPTKTAVNTFLCVYNYYGYEKLEYWYPVVSCCSISFLILSISSSRIQIKYLSPSPWTGLLLLAPDWEIWWSVAKYALNDFAASRVSKIHLTSISSAPRKCLFASSWKCYRKSVNQTHFVLSLECNAVTHCAKRRQGGCRL